MNSREHLIMTVCVLIVMFALIGAGGCTQISHSSDPGFTYPTSAKEALRL